MPPGSDDPWDSAQSIAAPLTAFVDDDDAQPVAAERYEVRGSVGQGGMGQVDVVRDRWLDRDVAKKVLHDGVRDARLAREAAITARLEHPGIVPIFDTGFDASGRRFYTMRLVRGQTLLDALNTPTLATRLEHVRALLAAANAVAHAHSVGIVHRDIKPSNILLGRFGQVQVVDWGIAHDDGADGRPEGTPGYSHPGQLSGDAVDKTHDVYALGRCLVHLLLGDRPAPGTLPPKDAPPELLAIVERATGPAPYEDAAAVAIDLEAYLDGRQVSAHAYSTRELLSRFIRTFRTPLLVGLTGGVAVALVTTVSVVRTQAERDRALAAEATANDALGASLTAQAVSHFEDGQFPEAERAAARALALGEFPLATGVLAAQHGDSVRWLGSFPTPCDDHHIQFNGDVGCVFDDRVDIFSATGDLIRSLPDAAASSVRGVTGGYVTVADIVGRDTDAVRLTFHPDTGDAVSQEAVSGRVAIGGGDIHLHHPPISSTYWNVVNNTVHEWTPCPVPSNPPTGRPVWRDDGLLSWTCNDELVWGVPPQADGRLTLDSPIAATAWTANLQLATTYDGALRAYEDGELAWSVQPAGGTAGQVTADDDWVIARPERAGPQFLDANTQLWHRALPVTDAGSVRLFDGRLTTIAERVSTWSVGPPTRPHRVPMPGGVTSISWSDNGQLAVSAGSTVVFVDERGGSVTHEQPACRPVKDIAWQGEDRVIRQCAGPTARLAWVTSTAQELQVPTAGPGGRAVSSRDWALSASYGRGIYRVTGLPGEDSVERYFLDDNTIDMEMSRAGRRAFMLAENGTLLSIGQQGEPISHWVRRGVRRISAAPTDDALVVATVGAIARVSVTGEESWSLQVTDNPTDVAWSDVGDLIAVGFMNGHTWILDATTGERIAELVGHNERVSSVAFSPDGDLLATGSWDKTVRLWNANSFRSPPSEQSVLARYGWQNTPPAR